MGERFSRVLFKCNNCCVVLHDYSLGISSNFHIQLWSVDIVGDAVVIGKEEVEVEVKVRGSLAVRESTGVAEEGASIVEEANGTIVEEEGANMDLPQTLESFEE